MSKSGYPFPALRLPPMRSPLMKEIRQEFALEYERQFGKSSGQGFYSNSDWRRLDYAATLIPEEASSVLDVGVGPGAMLSFLTLCRKYEKVTGIDIRKYSKYISLSMDVDFCIMDVAHLDLDDNSYDTVLCMEVLEHIDPKKFPKAVSELRRVAKSRLVMSVPFEEENLLPYHKQRFMRDQIQELFPTAEISLIFKPVEGAWPWAFLVEDNPEA